MSFSVRQITQPELWIDTSQQLTLAQYQFAALKGIRGCFRYIPLAGGGGGISDKEIADALSVICPDGQKFSLMFVQFARSGSSISAVTGKADGQAATAYLKARGVPNVVCWSQDLDVGAAASCIAYSNESFDASVATGWASSAPMSYMEPGYPLTAADRYSKLHVHRYWATAAADPNKMVANRGCQVLQGWGSSRGEFFLEPGFIVDIDLVQFDFFSQAPVALVAA